MTRTLRKGLTYARCVDAVHRAGVLVLTAGLDLTALGRRYVNAPGLFGQGQEKKDTGKAQLSFSPAVDNKTGLAGALDHERASDDYTNQ